MARIRAADGEQPLPPLPFQRHHGRRFDVVRFFGEELAQFLLAQGAAHRAVAAQQVAQCFVQVGEGHAAHLAADVAGEVQVPVIDQQADHVTAEILLERIDQVAKQRLAVARFHDPQHQIAGLLEEPVVVPGHIKEVIEPFAQFLVARAQHTGLTLQQRHRLAARVRQAQAFQQLRAFIEKLRMIPQPGRHLIRVDGLLFAHERVRPPDFSLSS